MRPARLLPIALLLALPAAGQTPADSLRAELVRSRGFIRAAETQASKTLDLLERTRAQTVPADGAGWVVVLPLGGGWRAVYRAPGGAGWTYLTVDSVGVVMTRDSLWTAPQ